MFSSPKLLKRTITFFVIVIFNFFIKQTLTDDFWGLHTQKYKLHISFKNKTSFLTKRVFPA